MYPYLFIIPLSLIAFGTYLDKVFEEFNINKTAESLKYEAYIIKEEIQKYNIDTNDTKKLIAKYDSLTDTRITIIDLNGVVVADSREIPEKMEIHNDRPEFIEALKGNVGYSVRYSHTLQNDLMYIAVPVYDSNNKVTAVLRASILVEKIKQAYSKFFISIFYGGLFLILIVTFFAYYISRKNEKPVLEMKNAAERFARGDFSRKIYYNKNYELNSLADSLNKMASQIDDKLHIIGGQKNLQFAVLESMLEGVLAVDYNERILLINKTAEVICNIDIENPVGKTIQEIVRIPGIHKFISSTFNNGSSLEEEIIIKQENDKILNLRGTVLFDSENKNIGVLIVINDITKLRYLDNLKRDFVANVSHELKTPITAIKGFIETLRDGALNDKENAERFLEIIAKHSERLNSIVEDLLSLSRLEQNNFEIKLEFENPVTIINSIIEDYRFQLKEKNINVLFDNKLTKDIKINKKLFIQAIGNLIDNAIKYSNENSSIKIETFESGNEVFINIIDEGMGILKEHFSRLFERFYRVDKSRSRDEGGTGLGLAIVKHIIQVHKGCIEVSSEYGKGSTFTVRIPAS